MNQIPDKILKRTYFIFLLFLLFGVSVIARVMYVQYFQYDKWQEKARKKKRYLKKIPATRGSIIADAGEILAITLPFYKAAIDPTTINPHDYPNLRDTLQTLAKLLEKHFKHKNPEKYSAKYFYEKIQKARASQDHHIYLFSSKEKFTIREIKLLKTFPVLRNSPFRGGLILEKINNKRFHPFGNLARITLGIFKDDTLPRNGIEYSFNRYLRGKDGYMIVEKVGKTEIPIAEIEGGKSEDGYDVKTTIDVNIQDVTHRAVADAVIKYNAKFGVAIVMEVATGKIKALVNYPEVYNRAVAGQAEPGSTFKIATLMALLEEGVVSLEDTIDTKDGTYQYYDKTMYDVGHTGKLTLQRAFEISSNIGISLPVFRNFDKNPQKFIDRLEEIGILEPSYCQLKGEPKPYIIAPDKKKMWNKVTLPWLAIGYNIKLTPLQILTFVNGIANNGKMISPLLVTSVLENGKVIKTFGNKVIRSEMASEKTLKAVRKLMEGVVKNGTAKNIYDPELPIAGKTGTVKVLKGGKYTDTYRSSFVGYFPAEAPKYSCIVVIYEPQGEKVYGGQVAAPVLKQIAEYLYSMDMRFAKPQEAPQSKIINLPVTSPVYQENAEIVYNHYNISTPNQALTDYVWTIQDGKTILYKPYEVIPGRMPDMKGMNLRDALALAGELKLQVTLKGHGNTIAKQSIPPGTYIRKGKKLKLYVTE